MSCNEKLHQPRGLICSNCCKSQNDIELRKHEDFWLVHCCSKTHWAMTVWFARLPSDCTSSVPMSSTFRRPRTPISVSADPIIAAFTSLLPRLASSVRPHNMCRSTCTWRWGWKGWYVCDWRRLEQRLAYSGLIGCCYCCIKKLVYIDHRSR